MALNHGDFFKEIRQDLPRLWQDRRDFAQAKKSSLPDYKPERYPDRDEQEKDRLEFEDFLFSSRMQPILLDVFESLCNHKSKINKLAIAAIQNRKDGMSFHSAEIALRKILLRETDKDLSDGSSIEIKVSPYLLDQDRDGWAFVVAEAIMLAIQRNPGWLALAKSDKKQSPKGFEGLGQKKSDRGGYYALAGLTSPQRDCFSLRFEYDLTYAEIGRRQGIARQTAKEYIETAIEKIKHSGLQAKRQRSPAKTTEEMGIDS